jgi:hypothetical protein
MKLIPPAELVPLVDWPPPSCLIQVARNVWFVHRLNAIELTVEWRGSDCETWPIMMPVEAGSKRKCPVVAIMLLPLLLLLSPDGTTVVGQCWTKDWDQGLAGNMGSSTE